MNNINSEKLHEIKVFFDESTFTLSYVVYDDLEKKCAVIDSVLDFDYSSGNIDYVNADKIISFINNKKLNLEWLIETHVHADHLSASPYIQNKLGGKIGISEKMLQPVCFSYINYMLLDNYLASQDICQFIFYFFQKNF